MRIIIGLTVLALGAAGPVLAQAQYAPRGSYERQCTDIRMDGQFLSATCRGARGGGQSSINVASCASDIGVDASGALSCAGPGAVAPAPNYTPSRGYATPSPYDRPGYGAPQGRLGRAGGRFSGYPEFRSTEQRIRRDIDDGVRDDLIAREDAADLIDQLRSIQAREAREYGVHGWTPSDDARRRFSRDLDNLERQVEQIRDEP